MIRTFLAVLFYVIAIPIVILAQKFFPSDGTGPGYNIYAFIVVFIYSVYTAYKNLRIAVLRDRESYTPFFIHVAGIAIILYLIFFDEIFMLKH